MNNFDNILFSNKNILQKPSRALKETYIDCENKFMEIYKPKNLLIPIEKSGSCALTLLNIGKKYIPQMQVTVVLYIVKKVVKRFIK